MEDDRPMGRSAQGAATGFNSFLEAVDAAVAASLPADWPRVPRARLPRLGTVRVRHCFRLARCKEPREYLALIAVPLAGAAESRATLKQTVGDLRSLATYVIARGVLLLLVYEQRSLESIDDLGRCVHQTISWPDPRLLAVGCAQDARGTPIVAPTAAGSEPLVETIRDLGSGALRYEGPRAGHQTVGVETMDRVCWHCGRVLATVTGIVVPGVEEGARKAPGLADSQYLLLLNELPAPDRCALMQAIDRWRADGERQISPIRYCYSKTVRASYWAAVCPWCAVLQGAFPVWDERFHLDGVEEALRYRELELGLTPELLRALDPGFETSSYPRTMGWCRKAPRP
ncbi:MAG: hypothetical protein M3O15_06155 [Acidobacteriota bacterium]|nr:hypothetical protein [Acidobacteriota bacterium]